MISKGAETILFNECPLVEEINCQNAYNLTLIKVGISKTITSKKQLAGKLHIEDCPNLEGVQFPILRECVSINCPKLTHVKTIASTINYQNCPLLEDFDLIHAATITLKDMSNIEKLDLNASFIELENLSNLVEINHAKGGDISCKNLPKLKRIDCPTGKLELIECPACELIDILKVKTLILTNCQVGPKLDISDAEIVKLRNCPNVVSVSAINAIDVSFIECPKLVVAKTHQAETANYVDCPALQILLNPNARNNFSLKDFPVLKIVDVAKTAKLELENLPELKYVDAQSATEFISKICPSLEKVNMPLARNVTYFDSLIPDVNSEIIETFTANSCPLLNRINLPAAKDVYVIDCISTQEILAQEASTIHFKNLPSLKVISTPKAINCTIDNCAIQWADLDHAEKINLKNLNQLIGFSANSAVEFTCSNLSVEVLKLPKAKDVTIRDCPVLREIGTNEAVQFSCSNTLIESVELPQAKYATITHSPALKKIQANEAEFLDGSNNPLVEEIYAGKARKVVLTNSYHKLRYLNVTAEGLLGALHQDKINLLSVPLLKLPSKQLKKVGKFGTYEINPLSFNWGKYSEIPDVPKVELPKENIDPNLTNRLKKRLNEINFKDNKAHYYHSDDQIINGGIVYSKEQLEMGLTIYFQILNSPVCHQSSKEWIGSLLAILTRELEENGNGRHAAGPNQLSESQIIRSIKDSQIIRLAVAGLESVKNSEANIPMIERDLQILYTLNQLETDFKAINFDEPKITAYFDPDKLYDDHRKKITPAHLKQGIRHIFLHLLNRKRHFGIPTENESNGHQELRLYYHNLEQYLQLIAINLNNMKDLEAKGRLLIDFAMAGLHCGERWMADAIAAYDLSNTDLKFLTMQDRIYLTDARLRLGIIEELSKSQGNIINVHKYDQYIRLIGEEYGIKNAGALKDIPDVPMDKNLTYEIAKENFQKQYHFMRVIDFQRDFLLTLYKNIGTRDLFLDYFKNLISPKWIDRKFGGNIAKINQIIAEAPNRNVIRGKLSGELDFICRPDWDEGKVLNFLEDTINADFKNNFPFKDDHPHLSNEEFEVIVEKHLSQINSNKQILRDIEQKLAEKLTESEKREIFSSFGINPGPGSPDFLTEYLLTVINPTYLNSIMKQNGFLELFAVCHLLTEVGKIKAIEKEEKAAVNIIEIEEAADLPPAEEPVNLLPVVEELD